MAFRSRVTQYASRAANRAWALASARSARQFRRALAEPVAAQERVLHEIVRANRHSEAGRRFGFGAIRSLAEWRTAVPVQSWDDIAPDVERVAHGEPGVLTAEPVRLLEPTGGSSGGTKLIPYTATLQRQIQRAVATWIADLFAHIPGAMNGPAYWSVSPALPERRSPGGLPIGFEDDGAYLSPLHRALARQVMAVPSAVRHIEATDAFRYATLRTLLAREDLALVSVWNPTFLSLLLAPLRDWGGRLARDLRHGTLTPPTPLSPAAHAVLAAEIGENREAADRLAHALRQRSDADAVRVLWPRLALVSAWADGHAAGPARDLAALFPHAQFQPKGLIATEGIVTIPLVGHEGAVPALTSHLVEFAPLGGGEPVWAHEAEIGRRYSVVLSTGGGLYRYRLGDVVEVVGRVERSPLLRFIGREGGVVDLVGEKLHETHVAEALRASGIRGFAMLAPVESTPPHYALFSDAEPAALAEAVGGMECHLRRNVHYAYARDLGQLGPLQAFRIDGDGGNAYLRGCAALGQRLGDVKPVALHRQPGWETRFRGRWI